jgi:DNA/RNA endonuclease YhcR with UshA esterase domain
MPLPRPRRLAPPLILAALSLASAVSAADPGRGPATLERPAATAIAPEDAREHVGQKCTVEFVVKGGRKLDDKEICFLNSNRDHRESDTFTAVIFRGGLARFAADGIDNPSDAFLGKTIRVSGTVEERSGQAQIVVDSPTQIEVLADGDDDEDGAVSPDPQDR